MKSRFKILIVILGMVTQLSGQNGWTLYNDTNSNFGNGGVSSIDIDQNGIIWATMGFTPGIAFFDGDSWSRLSRSNSNMASDFVYDLIVDSENKVWVGTLDGVSVYDGNDFINYDYTNTDLLGRLVYTLGKANDGSIWLASRDGVNGEKGITVYDGSTWTNLTNYPSQIEGTEFHEFAFASSGDVWLTGNGISKYNGSFSFYPQVVTGLWNSESVAIDAKDNVWVGGFSGLLKYDGSNWDFIDNADLGLPSNTHYYDIYPVGDYLWIGTSDGFLKFNTTTNQIEMVFNSTNSPLEENGVYAIERDSEGVFWMGTSIGVVRFDEDAVVATNTTYSNNDIQVYPNPTSGSVYVEIDVNESDLSSYRIEIFDLTGRKVFNKIVDESANTSRVDLSSLSKGCYSMNIYVNQSMTVKKVIVH